MEKVPTQIRRGKQRLPRKYAKRDEVLANKFEDFQMSPLDTQHLLISALLPPAENAELKARVDKQDEELRKIKEKLGIE